MAKSLIDMNVLLNMAKFYHIFFSRMHILIFPDFKKMSRMQLRDVGEGLELAKGIIFRINAYKL